ncbi:MAG: alpha-2-macroglobulin [Rubrivivax sp.]|nr:alpha-2-macroglobulin [Rubrivivax sp.]
MALWPLIGLLTLAGAADAARVAGVTPSGEVAEVRQIVLRFDGAVARLGDPAQRAPATLQCDGGTPRGDAHWLDERRWAFDLAEPLAAGRRCRLRLDPSFRPADGSALEGASEFAFATGAPTVVALQPVPGTRIDEDQSFLLLLNGEVDPASLRRHAWCEVEGLGERIALRALDAAARDKLLRRWRRQAEPRHALLLACERAFAPEARVRLVWGAGVAAAGRPDLVSRQERRWQWQVRPRLLAELSCERERAGAPCMPLRPLVLRFNAPVPRALALAARLEPAAGGAALAPQADASGAQQLEELRFAAPLPENARLRLVLPPDLKDDSGRALANAASFPLEVATGGLPPLAKFPGGAAFGVVEAGSAEEPALLPITLRRVQADVAGARTGGQVAVRRFDAATDDATLLAWIARVARWHEGRLSAREAGLPAQDWSVVETETDARGRARQVRRERFVATRERALLAGDAQARRIELPARDGANAAAAEVLGLPLPARGYHVVELESRLLGAALLERRAPMYVRTGALVTNLAVHFKKGRSSSLVWVTSLDRGRPVADARVAVADCNGKPLWSGRTDAAGIARIARGFDDDAGSERCTSADGLFVTARKRDADGDDLAFVFSRWTRGIEAWRFNLPTSGASGTNRVAHTVFDRTLLRRGEALSMKHFVRDETERGLALPAPDTLPDEVRLTHLASDYEAKLPLAWPRGARAAESRWTVPATAPLGLYEVALQRGGQHLTSGRVRVEAFRVPLVDARLAAPRGTQVAPRELVFAAQLAAQAGGPMPDAPLELSALLRSAPPGFAGYEDFSFAPARTRVRPDEEDAENDDAKVVARRIAARTDKAGAARIVVPALPALAGPSELVAELSFDDPSGERQTVTQRLRLWPSALVVGLRLPDWTAARGDARLTAVVLDTEGKPLAGREVEVQGRLHRTLSTRTRIVGGFYAYDNRDETSPLGRLCSGRSDAQGRVACEVKLDASGEVELVASARDDAGRRAEAAAGVWVSGGERWWFAQDQDDRIDILPERREWQPGETARLQVRMPFREATALVTVEREGVLDARVLRLDGRAPVIELPIPRDPDRAEGAGRPNRPNRPNGRDGPDGPGGAAGSWAPNVDVGVFVLRGRLREAPWWSFFTWGWRNPADWWRAWRHENPDWRAPGASVDLAKPSFKFGVAALRIGRAEHRLDVQVRTDRGQYAVREKVQATVRVTQAGRPAAGAEIAFAAVDEGLLALADNDSWRLLEGLLRERPWGVETATVVGEVIGRRHYGRKALPPGGGGGRNPTRELFDTLLLWRGTVALDARGEAKIEVPLNDSLSSFRLVAIADDGGERFGTGSTSVRVSQDLQLLAGLAPLVRAGDRFDAGFTLRNGSERTLAVTATLAGQAQREGGAQAIALAPQRVTLAPGAAHELRWSVEVPPGTTRLDWEAAAEETGRSAAPARDRMKLSQAVHSPVPLRVWQATLQPLAGPLVIALAPPADALPGSGRLQATLQPSLAGTLPGLRRYFENYPYGCLEQKVARAIGLRDAAAWAALRDELAGYLDRDGLANYFPAAAEDAPAGSDRLTAHLLAAAHEAGWNWPDAAREAMLHGLVAFVEGRLERRAPAPRADRDWRRLAALEALARYGRAEPRMLASVAYAPAAWPTSALLDAWSLYERLPGAPERAARLAQIQQLLRTRLVDSGSTLRLAGDADGSAWWLMESADGDAARLLLAASAAGAAAAWQDDAPRLLNGALARQQRGAWSTTTANLWGALALEKFAARFEREPVAGRSVLRVQAGAERSERSVDWARSPQGERFTLPLPAAGVRLQAGHEGSGRPWLALQTLAAVPLHAPLAAGYRLARSVSAVERKRPDAWSRGDLMRVRLEIEAQGDFSWVVLSDPLPAGAAVLGSGLGRDSALATRGERRDGSAWPTYEERAADAWRAYYAWLPRGRHVIEYTLRLNASGRFGLPPARVEAMYAPENFGELPLAALEVLP